MMLVMQHGLAAVEILHKLGDAPAYETLRGGLRRFSVGGALVGDEIVSPVEEGHLAKTLGQRVVVELCAAKMVFVGRKWILVPRACCARLGAVRWWDRHN